METIAGCDFQIIFLQEGKQWKQLQLISCTDSPSNSALTGSFWVDESMGVLACKNCRAVSPGTKLPLQSCRQKNRCNPGNVDVCLRNEKNSAFLFSSVLVRPITYLPDSSRCLLWVLCPALPTVFRSVADCKAKLFLLSWKMRRVASRRKTNLCLIAVESQVARIFLIKHDSSWVALHLRCLQLGSEIMTLSLRCWPVAERDRYVSSTTSNSNGSTVIYHWYNQQDRIYWSKSTRFINTAHILVMTKRIYAGPRRWGLDDHFIVIPLEGITGWWFQTSIWLSRVFSQPWLVGDVGDCAYFWVLGDLPPSRSAVWCHSFSLDLCWPISGINRPWTSTSQRLPSLGMVQETYYLIYLSFMVKHSLFFVWGWLERDFDSVFLGSIRFAVTILLSEMLSSASLVDGLEHFGYWQLRHSWKCLS